MIRPTDWKQAVAWSFIGAILVGCIGAMGWLYVQIAKSAGVGTVAVMLAVSVGFPAAFGWSLKHL